MSVKILLVDDHKIIRDGLKALLAQQPDMEVVAEADNGRMGVNLANKLKPDIVIMDISLPDLNGVDASRQILAQTTGVKIVALSMHSDRQFIEQMLLAGVSGYVLKDSAFEELALAIKCVTKNQMYVSPEIAERIIKGYVSQLADANCVTSVSLTLREREVLQLIAEGYTTSETASKLHLSVKTVETHRKNIMDKLEIRSIAELTKYAIRHGITHLGG